MILAVIVTIVASIEIAARLDRYLRFDQEPRPHYTGRK